MPPGFTRVTLLEEPLAALYAWIAAHRRALATDVRHWCAGSGLRRRRRDHRLQPDPRRATTQVASCVFERIAIGEHLLLGGDNLDLALAVLVEQKLGEAREAVARSAADAAAEVQRRQGAAAVARRRRAACRSRFSAPVAASSAAA